MDIAVNQYKEEQNMVNALYSKDYRKEIYNSVKRIFDMDMGIMAVEDGKLVGYLAFGGIWDRESSSTKETASLLCGYGISKGYDRSKVA